MLLLYIFGVVLVAAGVAAAAVYALIVAIIGACWASAEAYRQRRGRPYVARRFAAVWSRGMSPIDPKHWVTPVLMPATDPHLLPGQLTGDLRVEALGSERKPRRGPHEKLVIHARIHNHGIQAVWLDHLDQVDVQVWNPEGKVVGSDTTWEPAALPAGTFCEATITVTLVDEQPVSSWAIGHRPDGPYVFFPL